MSEGTNVGSVFFKISSNRGAFTKEMKTTASGVQNSFGSAMKAVGKSIGVAFSVAAVVSFGKKCIQVASETQSAWMGLSSIINGQGKDFGRANAFIQDYIKDGLVPLNNAVTAYKNLAARGYDQSQIESVMNALKDSAAFGRQASLSYGDAIQSATEGLKNENSVLVDNAGVTKNVSKMWEEYAKSIGTTSSALTQQQKIQAEVNGILQETRWQTGDAAKYSHTFAGGIARISATSTQLKTAIGNTLIPVLNQLLPLIQTGLELALSFCNAMQSVMASLGWEMPDVSDFSAAIGSVSTDAVNAATATEGVGTAAETAAKKAKKAFASFDEINVLNTQKADTTSSGNSGSGTSSFSVGEVTAPTNKMKAELGTAFDPLVNAWISKGTTLVTSIKTAFSDIKGLFGELKLSFTQIWENGTAQTTLELLLSMLANVFNIIGNISSAFSNAWKNNDGTAVIQNYNNALNDILFIADDIGICISDWWKSDAGQAFAGTMVATFGKVSNAVSRVTKTIRDLWENGGRDVFNNLQNLIGNVGEVLGIVIGYIADLYADLVEWFAPDAQNALGFVNEALSDMNGVFEWLKTDGKPILEGIAYTLGLVGAAWLTYKSYVLACEIASKAYAATQAIVNAVMNANPIGLVVAAIAALIAVIIVCVKHWDEIKAAAVAAWGKIKETWSSVCDWFSQNIVEPIKNFFTGLWTSVQNTFSNVKTFFTNAFTQAWNGVKNVFSSVGSFFGNIWNTIKSKFTSIGTKIGDAVGVAFKKAVNSVLATIENVANTPIRAINSLLGVINKVPGINLGRLNEFSLPRLAQGGWVAANNPQLAIIGDNKREGEIVTPESKIREQVEMALAKFGGMVQKVKLELEILIRYPDGRTIIKRINEAQIAEGRILLEV